MKSGLLSDKMVIGRLVGLLTGVLKDRNSVNVWKELYDGYLFLKYI